MGSHQRVLRRGRRHDPESVIQPWKARPGMREDIGSRETIEEAGMVVQKSNVEV